VKHLRRLSLSAALALVLAPLPGAPVQAQDGLAGAYLAARQAILANDFANSASYLARVLDQDAENPFMLENALLAQISLGAFAKAVPLAHRLEALGVRSQSARLVLITDMLAQGEYEVVLDDLLSEDAVGPLVDGLLRAWMHLAQGSMSDTLGTLDAIAEQPGLQAFGLYHKALALAFVGDLESAEEILSGAAAGPIQVGRRGVIARLQILSQLERSADALELLDQVFGTDRSPEIVEIRDALESGDAMPFDIVTSPIDGMAEVFFDVAGTIRGETDDSLTLIYARLAQKLRPDHVAAALMSARLLAALGQYDLAVSAFASVPAGDPSFHLAEIGRSEALYEGGHVADAIEVLRALSESHSDIAGVHITLGDLLRREDEFDAASRAYDKAVALLGQPEPQHWSLYYTRAITHEREDRWEEAEADFRLALELNPEQPHVLNYLGYSLVERREKLDEALDMIERAVAGEPDNGYITDSLGWVLYRLGRYEDAVEPMERAAQLLPRDPIVNDHLGDVYWAVGRRLEARFQWRRALSFDPEEEDLERIRRKLEVGLDQVLIEEGATPHDDVRASGN